MEISFEEPSPLDLELASAILLYQPKPGANGEPVYNRNGRSVAVYHDVQQTKTGPNFGPGALVTASLVDRLLNLYDDAAPRYVPPNVVAIGRRSLAWYEPPSRRRLYFRPTTDTAVAAFDGLLFPQPALLFVARPHKLIVYALAETERPVLTTPLALAPYWNTDDHGNVCLGSMQVPKQIDPATIEKWSAAFFESEFTHHTGSRKRWKHAGTYAEFLAALKEQDDFPTPWLVTTNAQVKDVLG